MRLLSLLHDLYIHLVHVHFLAELWWKFGLLQQLSIHIASHDEDI